MTKRDFFILIIKVFGLYSLVTSVFSILPMTISYLTIELDIYSVGAFILSLGVSVSLMIFLLFKSHYVADKLKLDKGFSEERIEISNFSEVGIIKLFCLLYGGYLIISQIPGLISHLYYSIKYDGIELDFGILNPFDLVFSIINLTIGYLLITNFCQVAQLLHKPSEK